MHATEEAEGDPSLIKTECSLCKFNYLKLFMLGFLIFLKEISCQGLNSSSFISFFKVSENSITAMALSSGETTSGQVIEILNNSLYCL